MLSLFDLYFIYKFFSRTLTREVNFKEKLTFSGIILFFAPFVLLPIFSNSGPSNNKDNFIPPFRSGKYYILQGGNNPLINAHYFYKDQKYALDIVKLCEKEESFYNTYKDNTSFCIWNEPLVSVCDGTVLNVVTTLKDNAAYSESDRQNPKGNHILLKCNNGYEILYAHLKQNSSTLKVGDFVKAGLQIGNVGNSGNTSEPHLHIQANLNNEPQVLFFSQMSFKKYDLLEI